MIRKVVGMLVVVLLLGVTLSRVTGAPEVSGQPFVLKGKLLASAQQGSAEFGQALALSRDGQMMVVGARYHDVASQNNQGQATVYKRNADDTWTEEQTLLAPDGSGNDEFGTAVAIANAPDYTIVVGAPYSANGTGSAYVFSYNGTSWDSGTKLTISDADPEENDQRGTAVAVSDDSSTIFVGAPGGGTGSLAPGAVFVLKASGPSWTHDETLTGPTGGRASMGQRLLLNDDNDLLFVSGLFAPSGPILDHGAVHIYQNTGTWVYDEMLSASDTSGNNEFGLGMDISEDENHLLIGAPGKDAGQVYLFSPGGGSWVQDDILQKPAAQIYGEFGQSVAVDSAGTSIAVGAWLNGSGGIYTYEFSGGNWQHRQTLTTSDSRQEHLGYAIAMTSGADMIVGGARWAHSGTTMDSVGAVYTFVPGYQSFLPMIVR